MNPRFDAPWPGVITRRDPHRPKAAPAFRCSQCSHWIGKDKPVAIMITDGNIPSAVCIKCADADTAIRLRFGTRAGTARMLGIWPRRAP